MEPPTPAGAVLVTGGAGFIGSHVAEALLRRGETVIIADEVPRRIIDINQSRAKGSRLTNIKVAINSQNTERCTYGSDLGESQVIVGGP